jgi:uncharacterized membrane protein YbhN (UPF0104 family)/membrane-associated phospholipid phosphatase
LDRAASVERRPGDFARVAVGALGATVVGIWAQANSTLDGDLARVVNGLGGELEGLAHWIIGIALALTLASVVLLLVVARQPRAAVGVLAAAAVAVAVATLLNDALGARAVAGIVVREGDGPSYPSVAVAVVAAAALALSPHVIRPVRRLSLVVVALVALATMYLGAAVAADALGGLLLGVAAGALALVAFGAPGGRPTVNAVRAALTELGFDVSDLRIAAEQIPRAAVMDAELTTGERIRVAAFGRDQRDAQVAAKIWDSAMYRRPGLPLFGSRLQQVEHIAYACLLAEKAGVRVPRLIRTGVAGPDAAILVTERTGGQPLSSLDADAVTDGLLADAWQELDRLHRAGIAHGDVDASRVLVAAEPAGRPGVQLAGMHAAVVTGDPFWQERDRVTMLVSTSLIVGNERAIAAAVAALGPEAVGGLQSYVQPAALPARTQRSLSGHKKHLKELRAEIGTSTGVEDVPPLKIRRLTLVNVGMLAGVLLALAIAIPGLEAVDFASVADQFADATWGWAVLALLLYPLVPASWATALMGCVKRDLAFVPTVLTQLACSFLNLVTPNGIGGTALQVDYLHKEGIPLASAGSAMVLSTGVGGAIQMILLVSAAALTATSLDLGGGSASLWAIALGAALIGIVLAIPKLRGKVVPAVHKAGSDIWSVLRNPRKGLQLFGGDLAGNLIYPALLGLCLLAFGESLSFTQLIVVQIGAGVLGNVAPVPGGIGVQEAALTGGLTSFGIDANTALATVLLFRGITFALPPVFGFFTLRWLREHGYA